MIGPLLTIYIYTNSECVDAAIMGSTKAAIHGHLSDYVKECFLNGKADLMTSFMERSGESPIHAYLCRVGGAGMYGVIDMQRVFGEH